MTRVRRIGFILLALSLAVGVPVLGVSIPAGAASTSVLTPRDGAVIKRGSQVPAKAEFDFAVEMRLLVDMPGAPNTLLAKRNLAGSLSGTIPLRRNGSYKVYLKGGVTGHIYDANTFTVRIPPARPTGLSAKASGSEVVVRWNHGLEDDISGYTVSAGPAGTRSGTPGSFCSGTSCTTTMSLPSGTSGSIPIGVRAKRPDGFGGSVSSGTASTSASAAGAPGGSLGSMPSSVPGAPPPGGAPLTPFNGEYPVQLPAVQPDGAAAGYAYPTPQVADEASSQSDASAIGGLQWSQSVGIALVLLILAAHLGMWTRRLRLAQAGLSDKGKAARIARGGTGRNRVSSTRERIAKAEATAKAGELAGLMGIKKHDGHRHASVIASAKAVRRPAGRSRTRRRPAALGRATKGGIVRTTEPH